MFYLLGDNRGQSNDSRHFGPVPAEWIILDFGGLADHGGPGLLDRGDFLLVGGAEPSG